MHPARIVRRAKILGIIAGQQQQQQKKDEITLSLMRPRSWMSLPPCVAGAHTHTTGPVVDGALSFEAAHKICVTRQVIHISSSLLPHNLIPFALHNESGWQKKYENWPMPQNNSETDCWPGLCSQTDDGWNFILFYFILFISGFLFYFIDGDEETWGHCLLPAFR